MKKKILYILVTLLTGMLVSTQTKAQLGSDDAETGCGASEFSLGLLFSPPWAQNHEYLFDILDKEGYYTTSDSLDYIVYRIPIKLFVYKRSKNPLVTDEVIKTYIQELNHYNLLNRTGIVYYLNDRPEIETNDRKARLGYYLEAPWISLWNYERGCVNVHIAEYINKGKGTVRGTYNYATKSAFVKANSSSTSLAHEIAHHFDLLHPHRHWKRGKMRQESVDRNRKIKFSLFRHGRNCDNNGDKLCDTQAEPNLTNFVNKQCEYTGTNTDNWGDAYHPETNNIMSYPTYRDCRNEFTPSQIAVMLAAASKSRHASGWKVKNKGQNVNQQLNFDFNEPDNTLKMATELKMGERQWHSFHSIYKGKRKKSAVDVCDWVRVYIADNKPVTLRLVSAQAAMPTVSLQAFNSSEKLVSTESADAYTITIPSGFEGQTVYIKITNKSKNPYSDYYLEWVK